MATCVLMVGCAMGSADDGKTGRRGGIVPPKADGADMPSEAAIEGWVLPPAVRAAGEMQTGVYTGADAWDDGGNCAGDLAEGTRALAGWIVTTFDGDIAFGGYACEPSRADRTRMSMYGSGRAFAIRVPVAIGEFPDSATGDPIANHLVENAEALGVQFIVWNRTKWNISYTGRKEAPQQNGDPHLDRIYVELTPEAAATPTAMVAPPEEPDPPPAEEPPAEEPPPAPRPDGGDSGGLLCSNSCRFAADFECDDGGPGALFDVCRYGTDCFDCGPRRRP